MGLVERAAYYTYRGDKLEFLKKPGNSIWLVPNIGEPKGDETKGEANGVEAAELALAELPCRRSDVHLTRQITQIG
jgi:hypothetical protein